MAKLHRFELYNYLQGRLRSSPVVELQRGLQVDGSAGQLSFVTEQLSTRSIASVRVVGSWSWSRVASDL